MYLIVGLGNPGKKYSQTRHNVGWLILDSFLTKNEKWHESKNISAFYYQKTLGGQLIELIKPTTFMNDSGRAVAHAKKKYRIKTENIIIIHDDKDIPLGKMKLQINRGDAGHNGIKSIIQYLKTKNFIRLRIGIKPVNANKDISADKLVLNKFSVREKDIITAQLPKMAEIVKIILEHGTAKAMNFLPK